MIIHGTSVLLRNIRLYPFFQFCQSLIFWMPVFFLYFSSRFSLNDVLRLEAIYYFSVVVLEVPSGYFSDRIGRRTTLLISSICWCAACIIFFSASYLNAGFHWFVSAQFLVAAGMAFRSGTDSALLFESLRNTGRANEIAIHESKAQTATLAGLAISALLGGVVAMGGLQHPYLLSAISAGAATGIAYCFVEPLKSDTGRQSVANTLRIIYSTRADTVLMCSLGFSVALTVFTHVPYEFLQPYIDFSLSGSNDQQQWGQTPLISGLVLAVTMGIGALGSHLALRLCRKIGAGGVLLVAMGVCAIIIFAMTTLVHWLIILLALLRSLSSGIATPILNAIVHQRLVDSVRATYFSLQSLLGRLAFAVTLFAAASMVGQEEELNVATLHELLAGYSVLLLLVLPLLFIGAKILNKHLPSDLGSDNS